MRITRAFAILLTLACAFGTSCASAGQQGIASRETAAQMKVILVRGNTLSLPIDYIPLEDRESFSDARTHDVLRLKVDWPTGRPFVPSSENVPPHIRYRNELSVTLDPSGAKSIEERTDALQRLLTSWLPRHVATTEQYGLRRFMLQSNAHSPVGVEDILVTDRGAPTTVITCMQDAVIDPHSPLADRLRRSGTMIRIPQCSQYFYAPTIDNVIIKLTYFKVHLKDWEAMQISVNSLLTRSKLPQAYHH